MIGITRPVGRRALLDQRDRIAQYIHAGARLDAVLGEVTAERPRARHAVKRADKMPRDRMQSRALRELVLDIGHHRLENVLHGRVRRSLAEQLGIRRQQSPRLLIGRAPQHHAVDVNKMPLGLAEAGDAAIDDDGHVGHGSLQPVDPIVVERRDVAIFLRRQSIEPGLAGVDDQRIGAGSDHAAGQRIQRDFRILVVDADPALDRDRNAHCALHGIDAFSDQRRLRHQAGAETAVLHPVRRTADIEIDLVIAEILADFRRGGEIARVGTAELQRHRMLAGIETKQPPAIAMNDGAGRQHLRIKPGMPRHQPMEHAAMPVGPVHHGRDGKSM